MWPSAPLYFKVTAKKIMKHICGWIWGVNECSHWHAYIATVCVDNCKFAGKKSLAVIPWWCQFPNRILWNIIHLLQHVNLLSLSGATHLIPDLSLPWPSCSAKLISSSNLWHGAIHLLGAEWAFNFGQLLHLVFSTGMSLLGPSPTVSQVLLSGCGCLYLHVTTCHCSYFLKLMSQALHGFLFFY